MWYVQQLTILEKLVLSSPVPISFVSGLKSGKSTHENSTRLGTFYAEPVPSIEILGSLSHDEKMAAVIHEISHAICFKNKCKCRDMDVLGEVHAHKHTLKWLMDNKLKKALKREMIHLYRMLERKDYYNEATKQVMKTKLWQKCADFCNFQPYRAENGDVI